MSPSNLLRPCPFCEQDESMFEVVEMSADPIDGGYGFKVHCLTCHACGPVKDTEDEARMVWGIITACIDLQVDPSRVGNTETGIFARTPSGMSVDIADLDRPSLRTWLRSRGGANQWAESTVFILLNHGVEP